MFVSIFRALAQALRYAVGIAALVAVLWSFYWVLTRPLRAAAQRGDKLELTIMHWAGGGGQEEDAITRGLIEEFQRRNPDISVKRINPGDAASFYTKLQTMMAAGNPPDVFQMGAERVGNFAAQDLLEPLEPWIETDRKDGRATLEFDGFFRAPLDAFRFDGQGTGRGPLYVVPKDFTTVGFYYNKQLFDEARVPYPADDWTWDDFVDAARKIGAIDGAVGAEFVTWPAMMRIYLWTYGVDIVDENFESRARDPEVTAALEQFRKWRFEEERTLTSGKSKVAEGEKVFLTGSVGMAGPFGRWVVPTYRKITDFDWDFAPLPRGTTKANGVFTSGWGIARSSKEKELAWKLLKFLCGEEAQAQTSRLGLAIPSLRTTAYSDAFIQADVKPSRDTVFLDQAEYARVVPWPSDFQFESRMQNRLDTAIKTGTAKLPDAIARLEADWKADRENPLLSAQYAPMPWSRIVLLISIPLAIAALVTALLWWRFRPRRNALREEIAGYTMVSPWVIGFVAFMAFPIILSLLLSFSKWSGVSTLGHAQSVGLDNYRYLIFADSRFWVSLRVTLFYALIAVPIGQLLALIAALLLAHNVRFSGIFRSAWYLPSVLAGVGVAILWRWVFDGDHGLMNNFLAGPIAHLFGADPPAWFDKDAAGWGPPAFAIMSFWTIGGTMVIYLAGIKGIPQDLYEAASIDGSGTFGRFLNVTLPMLSPVIFFNFIMAIIGSFQVFTQAFVMTGGEPGDLTRFYVLYLYNHAFDFHHMGYASAMAWILLVIILGLTLLVMRGSRRYVYYEALK